METSLSAVPLLNTQYTSVQTLSFQGHVMMLDHGIITMAI